MNDDTELLRRYSEARDEGAFHELVERHFGLVYSTALRLVGGDVHLAEDVSQTVFADLARKTSLVLAQLPAKGEVLDGWLYTGTRFAAAKAVRAEQCRRGYEHEAQQMNEILNGQPMVSEPIWNELRPVLDDAMGKLSVVDRNALLLRFFKGKTLREVGKQLGLGEDAARMRVLRALDRLREILVQQGINTTTAALAVAVSSNAIGAVPSGLVATIASASLAGAVTATTSTTITILNLMTMTKLKIGAVSALIIAAVAVPVWQGIQLRRSSGEKSQMEAQLAELPVLKEDSTKLAQMRLDQSELNRLRAEHSDLLRLRGEVNRLRQQLQAEAGRDSKATNNAGLVTNAKEAAPLAAHASARMSSGETLVMKGWSNEPGKRTLVLVTPTIHPTTPDVGQVSFSSYFIEIPEDALASLALNDLRDEKLVLSANDAETLLKALGQVDARMLSGPRVSTVNGVQASVQIGPGKPQEGKTGLRTALDITPRLSDDRSTLDVEVNAQQDLQSSPSPGTNSVENVSPPHLSPPSLRGP